MTGWIRRLLRAVLGEYSIFRIFSLGRNDPIPTLPDVAPLGFATVAREQVAAHPDPLLASCQQYHGADCRAFALLSGATPVALCYFWFAERYKKRNFWPLDRHEAKLVQVVTGSEFRGKGTAATLVGLAAGEMFRQGFERLYARVWHSHTASIRTFQAAGWTRIATVIEINPLRRKSPFRITLRAGRSARPRCVGVPGRASP